MLFYHKLALTDIETVLISYIYLESCSYSAEKGKITNERSEMNDL